MNWEIFHNVFNFEFEFKFLCLILIFVIKEKLINGKIKYKKVILYGVISYISLVFFKIGRNSTKDHFENLMLIVLLFF